jgi:hypothetical protein
MTFAPNTAQDPVLHILTGACGALTTVVCADDLGPGGSESISFPTVIGQNYIIRVQTSGSNNAMADGQVCIYPTPPPPPNDEPCHAVFLDATTNCNTVVSSTNTSATPTLGIPDPGCYYGGQPDVWYSTIAPPSGHIYVDSYAVNGDGPGDSGMALYTAASCNQPMTLLVCNDDQDYPTDHMPAIGRSGLVPGDTVYIRFWAYYANEGSFLICASPDGSALPVELTSFTATVGKRRGRRKMVHRIGKGQRPFHRGTQHRQQDLRAHRAAPGCGQFADAVALRLGGPLTGTGHQLLPLGPSGYRWHYGTLGRGGLYGGWAAPSFALPEPRTGKAQRAACPAHARGCHALDQRNGGPLHGPSIRAALGP